MLRKMLIDAAYPEETRVAIINEQGKIEDFNFENHNKKQLRGDIYLAKVSRVEPSLQAVFVEYGGNRQGFLPFNEIHPDYYQIPYEDRVKILEEEALHASEDEEIEEIEKPKETLDPDLKIDETLNSDLNLEDEEIENTARNRHKVLKNYKVQEVIKRRQIILIQVVKEERGNKGAALTTYISLAGRYCVLMPNTPRGGGVSRKITNANDRNKLKSTIQGLNVPNGMGLIIRTAGSKRTKAEIKRDYDYLMRLWHTIRENTLKAVAPTLIHEEGSLVKRAIRDLYDRSVGLILVEGETAYKEAKTFIKMLMPSHAKKVQPYIRTNALPIFSEYHLEEQLDLIFNPVVPLESGGYLVIHHTEALIAIDVNSGRYTQERNIEKTALKTNLEASVEIARQMRLRDLAGLIVIDFIDMEEIKNNRTVEKKIKDTLKNDRARIQIKNISPFGLMEISRQRRRVGIFDLTSETCEHCQGTGYIRSEAPSVLRALRELEKQAIQQENQVLYLKANHSITLNILNEKRNRLSEIETRYHVTIKVEISTDLGFKGYLISSDKNLKNKSINHLKDKRENLENTQHSSHSIYKKQPKRNKHSTADQEYKRNTFNPNQKSRNKKQTKRKQGNSINQPKLNIEKQIMSEPEGMKILDDSAYNKLNSQETKAKTALDERSETKVKSKKQTAKTKTINQKQPSNFALKSEPKEIKTKQEVIEETLKQQTPISPKKIQKKAVESKPKTNSSKRMVRNRKNTQLKENEISVDNAKMAQNKQNTLEKGNTNSSEKIKMAQNRPNTPKKGNTNPSEKTKMAQNKPNIPKKGNTNSSEKTKTAQSKQDNTQLKEETNLHKIPIPKNTKKDQKPPKKGWWQKGF